MLKLDHLVIIAPSLELGGEYVRSTLGIVMPKGGEHPQMGTHNLLLRLGDDVFLEVIAINPAAPRPDRPRWFGLDDTASVQTAWEQGRRLRGWVAQTHDLDAVLTSHGPLLGQKTQVSRGDRSWFFSLLTDGSLPAGGVAPPVIDWGERGNPTAGMQDHGTLLRSFEIEHPDPEWVTGLYTTLGIINPPAVRYGEQFRFTALIETPTGLKELS